MSSCDRATVDYTRTDRASHSLLTKFSACPMSSLGLTDEATKSSSDHVFRRLQVIVFYRSIVADFLWSRGSFSRCASMSEDDIWFGSTARWLVPSTGTCELFADGLYEHDFSEEALEITVSRAAPLPAPDGGFTQFKAGFTQFR